MALEACYRSAFLALSGGDEPDNDDLDNPTTSLPRFFNFNQAGANAKESRDFGAPSGYIQFKDETMEYWLPEGAKFRPGSLESKS
jgi:hypothetical protein